MFSDTQKKFLDMATNKFFLPQEFIFLAQEFFSCMQKGKILVPRKKGLDSSFLLLLFLLLHHEKLPLHQKSFL